MKSYSSCQYITWKGDSCGCRDWTWDGLAETSFEFFRTWRFKGPAGVAPRTSPLIARADGMLISANQRSRSSYRSRVV